MKLIPDKQITPRLLLWLTRHSRHSKLVSSPQPPEEAVYIKRPRAPLPCLILRVRVEAVVRAPIATHFSPRSGGAGMCWTRAACTNVKETALSTVPIHSTPTVNHTPARFTNAIRTSAHLVSTWTIASGLYRVWCIPIPHVIGIVIGSGTVRTRSSRGITAPG